MQEAALRAFEKGEWDISQKEVTKFSLKITPSMLVMRKSLQKGQVLLVMVQGYVRKAAKQIGRAGLGATYMLFST
jgi:hypothetical protein